MWILYAILGAVFLAITSVLAKIGLQNINSTLATSIITVAVLAVNWSAVLITGAQKGITEISKKNLIFLGLCGLATGLSWIFYYKAIQLGPVNKVIPIDKLSLVLTLILSYFILHEAFSARAIFGAVLMIVGTVLIAMP